MGSNQTGAFQITSSAFANGATIPDKYTCHAENVSPPLSFNGVPQDTQSLTLIVHDPDAPGGDWTHWLLWNIPPQTTHFPEGTPLSGSVSGISDFGVPGYGGPCPPSGTHHYYFELYALDSKLQLPTSSRRSNVESALQGHILAHTVLMGTVKAQ